MHRKQEMLLNSSLFLRNWIRFFYALTWHKALLSMLPGSEILLVHVIYFIFTCVQSIVAVSIYVLEIEFEFLVPLLVTELCSICWQ
jgi:hypothetical protein